MLARPHPDGKDNALVTVKPLLDRVGDFAAFLAEAGEPTAVQALRPTERT